MLCACIKWATFFKINISFIHGWLDSHTENERKKKKHPHWVGIDYEWSWWLAKTANKEIKWNRREVQPAWHSHTRMQIKTIAQVPRTHENKADARAHNTPSTKYSGWRNEAISIQEKDPLKHTLSIAHKVYVLCRTCGKFTATFHDTPWTEWY